MSTKKTGVDQQLIRDLAGILNDTNLTEIEVEQGDLRVRVSRQAPAVHADRRAAACRYRAAPRLPPGRSSRRRRADMSKNAVTSPMVGTAYWRHRPTPSRSSRSARRSRKARRC